MNTNVISYSINHDLEVSATLTEVFQAISKPEHLINWWPLKCSGIPKVNEIYNFYFAPEYDWYGEVTKATENKTFHIKMTKSDADWDPTSFGFDLEPVKNKVRIKFWHTGWQSCNSEFRGSSYCWALLLNGLKKYVEKGIIIPFNEREE